MCLAPSLLLNPQARYFLSNNPASCTTYFAGKDYLYNTILADTIFNELLRSKDRKQYSALEIYEHYRNSFIYSNGNRYPLFVLCSCSHCVECRESYRKEIESRAIIEAAHSGTVLFYTLTYSNTHLPRYGLDKQHVVGAFKRLRQYINRHLDFGVTFTHVYVGEYGTDPRYTMRPHYHGLLFVKEVLTPLQILEFYRLFTGNHICYEEHDLDGFWPYGERFDLQVARNPLALTKYVTKYITKQYLYLNDSDFSPLALKVKGYQNPMFVQLPKRIGLGCRYIHEYADAILNTTDPFLHVRMMNGQLTRVRIPAIFIKKLIPSLSWYLPNAVYNAHLVKSLLSDKFSSLIPFNYLHALRERFAPYNYLTNFTLRRRQYIRLHRNIDAYYAFFTPCGDHSLGDIYHAIDLYLAELECCVPDCDNYYEMIVKRKHDYLKMKIQPDISTSDLLEQRSIQTSRAVNQCKSKLMFDGFSCVC